MDFRSYDWDDTELRKAWDKMEEKKKAKKKQSKANKKHKWKVGDYCQAMYPVDNMYYEARIIQMNGDFCTVEFVGYEGETEDVDLHELKESAGQEARAKQTLEALSESSDCDSSKDENEDTGDETVARSCVRKSPVKQPPNEAHIDESTFCQQYPAANYYAPPPMNLPFMPPPMPMPHFSMPPPPPMPPQFPNPESNPTLAAMLMSWYMAGYYTGLYSGRKENSGCRCCSKHSNHCCH